MKQHEEDDGEGGVDFFKEIEFWCTQGVLREPHRESRGVKVCTRKWVMKIMLI